jgi:hypothetical protein
LFHQVLKQILIRYRHRLSEGLEDVFRLGTTAVVAAHLTSASVAVILLWRRFEGIW